MFIAVNADPVNFRDYMGRDQAYEVSAALYDALMLNTDVTYKVAGGKKDLHLPSWPSPEDLIKRRIEEKQRNSVKGFYARLAATQ